MADRPNTLLMADAHVHFRPNYDIKTFLDAAWKNFSFVSGKLTGQSVPFAGFLLLTETLSEKRFPEWIQAADSGQNFGGWMPVKTGDDGCLQFTDFRGRELYVVAGWQIVTSERLEILSLFCSQPVPDGLPLETSWKMILDLKGVPVIPWGFGKWSGTRKKKLIRFLENSENRPVFLGTTRHRPKIFLETKLFRIAAQNCLSVFPGSDTLPMKGEEQMAGSFGLMIHHSGFITPDTPATALRSMLMAPSVSFSGYGQSETWIGFVINQVRLRI